MSQSWWNRSFGLIATVAVALGVVAGFWLLGTPNRQRQLAADRERLKALYQIAQELRYQALDLQNREKPVELPKALEDSTRRLDPITRVPYEYNRLSATRYQLCASFDTDTKTEPLPPSFENLHEDWEHPQGRHCFELDVLKVPSPLERSPH
jgi:hypothetical protein